MVEKEVVVVPEAGIHARPISNIVKAAEGFSSDVVVAKGEREANAKSIMKLLTLGAKQGDTVLVRADGEDEEAALAAVVEIISTEEAH